MNQITTSQNTATLSPLARYGFSAVFLILGLSLYFRQAHFGRIQPARLSLAMYALIAVGFSLPQSTRGWKTLKIAVFIASIVVVYFDYRASV